LVATALEDEWPQRARAMRVHLEPVVYQPVRPGGRAWSAAQVQRLLVRTGSKLVQLMGGALVERARARNTPRSCGAGKILAFVQFSREP